MIELNAWKQEVYNHYMDTALQVTVDRDPEDNSTGNGLLHAGVFYAYLGARGALTQLETDSFYAMIRMARVPGFRGLFHRSKFKLDEPQAHDDYLGILGASYFADKLVSLDILTHGRRFFYCWDNINPELWSFKKFFARFPGFIPLARMCAGERTNIFQNAALAGEILLNVWSKKSDAKMRTFLKCVVARNESWLCSLACSYWMKKTREQYGSIGNSFAEYFHGNTHPLTKIE